MKNKFIFIILTGLFILPSLIWAATTPPANSTSGLQQISPADLQQLQNIIKSFSASSISAQTSSGNDFPLDIVWQAYTLKPFDYPGKALPGALSRVVFYALASGVADPSKLTYTWIVDDASSTRDGPELTGVGQDRFSLVTFQIPKFTHELRLMATDEATGKSASAAVKIQNQQPETDLYLGYNNNYNNLFPETITFQPGESGSLLVRPFYFNALSLNDLIFNWTLNNQPQANSGSRLDMMDLKITDRTEPGTDINLGLGLTNKRMKDSVFERSTSRIQISVKK